MIQMHTALFACDEAAVIGLWVPFSVTRDDHVWTTNDYMMKVSVLAIHRSTAKIDLRRLVSGTGDLSKAATVTWPIWSAPVLAKCYETISLGWEDP